jgi:predicted RNA-binding Zn ribbon-like protein
MFQKLDDPVALPVELVNTWDELEDPPELLRDLTALRRLLERHGYAPQRLTQADLGRVKALRSSLRSVFEAADDEQAVGTLNRVLRDSHAKPQFERRGGTWALSWSGPAVDVLASTAALSLLEAIRDDGRDRFGTCAGAPCCCVFVDRSKNRSRRFCSDLCADRVAQAALRARRRAGGLQRR